MLQEVIRSDKAPKAVGPYSPAIKVGDFIFLSGQLPVNPETGKIDSDDIKDQTRQCLLNAKALLEEVGIGFEYVLKTNVYLTDMNDFAAMNEVYAEFFQEPYPARCAAGVNELALGAKVEIEMHAIDTRALEVLCADKNSCGACDESSVCDNATE